MNTDIFSLSNFSLLDTGIVTVYLLISVVIGLFVKDKITDMKDYICAGQNLGPCLGIATMTGTELGLVTVMYSAQKGFSAGFAAFHIAIAAAIATFFVGKTGFIVYKLREFKVLTIPEYYEKRFNRKVRILGAILMVVGGVLNMGLFLKIGSMFIVGITGLSQNSWALPLVMTTLLILVLVYTCLGGMVSVVITDYLQFVVLSFGLLLTVFLTIFHLGWDQIFKTIEVHMGEAGFNPFINESFGSEYVIWMFYLGLISCAVWPTSVSRALAMESPEAVKKQFKWCSISFLIRFLIPYFLGIGAFVYMHTLAPELQAAFFPEQSENGVNNLYAMPIFLGRILPIGLIGLIAAGMIAAFMSTHDSYLLCWSSVITQDIIAPIKKEKVSTSARILMTRVFIVLIGIYILYWGLFYEGKDDIWDYMAVTGAIYFTGAFSLLLGGLYWKRASSVGATLALLSGFFSIVGLSPVQNILNIEIPSARVGLYTIALSIISMVLGSLLFPDKKDKVQTA